MIVLVVTPSAAHIGDVSDTRAQAEYTLILTANGRYFWHVIRHREDPSPSRSVCNNPTGISLQV
jgi:hypothetical protein